MLALLALGLGCCIFDRAATPKTRSANATQTFELFLVDRASGKPVRNAQVFYCDSEVLRLHRVKERIDADYKKRRNIAELGVAVQSDSEGKVRVEVFPTGTNVIASEGPYYGQWRIHPETDVTLRQRTITMFQCRPLEVTVMDRANRPMNGIPIRLEESCTPPVLRPGPISLVIGETRRGVCSIARAESFLPSSLYPWKQTNRSSAECGLAIPGMNALLKPFPSGDAQVETLSFHLPAYGSMQIRVRGADQATREGTRFAVSAVDENFEADCVCNDDLITLPVLALGKRFTLSAFMKRASAKMEFAGPIADGECKKLDFALPQRASLEIQLSHPRLAYLNFGKSRPRLHDTLGYNYGPVDFDSLAFARIEGVSLGKTFFLRVRIEDNFDTAHFAGPTHPGEVVRQRVPIEFDKLPIHGRLLDANGRALPNAELWIAWGPNLYSGRLTDTNSDGRFLGHSDMWSGTLRHSIIRLELRDKHQRLLGWRTVSGSWQLGQKPIDLGDIRIGAATRIASGRLQNTALRSSFRYMKFHVQARDETPGKEQWRDMEVLHRLSGRERYELFAYGHFKKYRLRVLNRFTTHNRWIPFKSGTKDLDLD